MFKPAGVDLPGLSNMRMLGLRARASHSICHVPSSLRPSTIRISVASGSASCLFRLSRNAAIYAASFLHGTIILISTGPTVRIADSIGDLGVREFLDEDIEPLGVRR